MHAVAQESTERPEHLGVLCDLVRLRARLRLAWMSHLADGDRVKALLDDADSPEAEAAWQAETPEVASLRSELGSARDAWDALTDTPVDRLVQVLHLSLAEADLVALVLAASVDPQVGELCALLGGAGAAPTFATAARLFGHDRTLVLSKASPVLAWQLIALEAPRVGAPALVSMCASLVQWLSGEPVLDDALLAHARQVRPLDPLPRWPVTDTARRLEQVLGTGAPGAVLRVDGPVGSGRRTFAACVLGKLGLGLIAVDTGGVPAEQRATVELRAQRQAWLDHAGPAWVTPPSWSPFPPCFPVQVVLNGPGDRHQGPVDWPHIDVALPLPTVDERAALWRAIVPASTAWPSNELRALSRRHRVTVGEVRRAAWLAPDGATAASIEVKAAMRDKLGDLARRLPCTFTWDDLVVSEPVDVLLRELAYEAEVRGSLWEDAEIERLFPQGKGLIALVTGPPGTGKTMSAQVLAGQLGVDLFRIDLSALVSKYVGETSKNIEKVLAAAERLDALLFFDEADALFGKRTEIKDAHDRYANTDTNYLLQAIETWPGFAILASNRRGNLDAAFVRRLRHVIEFTPPDAALRLTLWQRLVGSMAGPEAAATLTEGFTRLANAFDLSGAQIKSAVLTALLEARRDAAPVSFPHLLSGVERELWKVGRGVSRADRARLELHASR
ncbi:MAG: ATP-binding protein [bacterium]|nr:ATP-binding protein [bacterium]